MAAQKKKTGAKRKPAQSRPQPHSQKASGKFGLVLTAALRGVINMAVVATVSATVLGGLLAVKHFGL